jgi:3-hydroxymyristoyl/3-hydroxydecanoyl-(acyl carrier protein) dehydratase
VLLGSAIRVNTTFDEDAMTQRRSSYAYEDLLACGRGELFGAGNAQLPLPPLLMLDRIMSIGETVGAHGKGQVVAELKIAGNPQLEWIFSCHFMRDPVMPGCFMLDALWQMTGFFLGWLGATGRDRPLGVGNEIDGHGDIGRRATRVRGRSEEGDATWTERRSF